MPVLLVDKPLGLTSHDVVARARKLLGTKHVGHAGTLDPLATGVLVLLSEEATKLSPFLTELDKRYLAWVSFGAGTPTLDAEGPVAETADASQLTREQLEAALPSFLKLTEQVPPQYSAIKQDGVKGYEAARRGEGLELPARPAGYHEVHLLGFAPTRDALPQRFSPLQGWRPAATGRRFELPEPLGAFPTALFDLQVRAGTYVRAFARDLGAALGVGAHLSGLVRTRAGGNGLEHAVPLESLPGAQGLRLADALPYPLVELDDAEVRRVRQGQRLNPGAQSGISGRLGLMDARRNLVAVVEVQEEQTKYLRVWLG